MIVETLKEAPQNCHSALDPQDNDLLNNEIEAAELATSPASQAQSLQESNGINTVEPPDLAQAATQARKQRALEKSREAQKRFRVRQKVLMFFICLCSETFLCSCCLAGVNDLW